ncbi:hypothetical protein [Paremcibacter congregatus]|uniref:hypothetical protein n=1 Tax=Paremcibacter congregatus TaxID=2043170 RepID=UPI0030EDFE97|tara:strand:- start:6896 stop:7336 length:441 start_codon:yes stop_codon:yes gene_type:complete
MKDIHSNMNVATLIGTAALSADNTPAAVDMQGYAAGEVIINVGIGGITFSGTNKVEFKLTHSDDDTTYTAVADSDVLGVTSVGAGGIVKSLVAAHAAAAGYRVGYIGGKRYLKLLADFSGTHGAATPIGAVVIQGHAHSQPVADQE